MSDLIENLKISSGEAFFTILEKCLDYGIPTNIKKILQFNHYDNAKSLSKLDKESITEIEHEMRYTFSKDMIADGEHIEDYLCRFANRQKDFKFVGGQLKIIDVVIEYCKKIYNTTTVTKSRTIKDPQTQSDVVFNHSDAVAFEEEKSKSFFKKIGSFMIEVYNDAKRMTLSAWSWPGRHVAHVLAGNFEREGSTSDQCGLHYVTPTNHETFIDCIVKSDVENVKRAIIESLAISIRLDGSTDRTQEHNIYTMAHIVNKDATTSTLFLGFGVPTSGGGDHYIECLKTVTKVIFKWEDLFLLTSSVVTDGEYLNSGEITGLFTRLQQERCNSIQVNKLPLFWLWCIAHRVNLAWSTTTKLNIIWSTICLCRDLSTHFHKSGVRTSKLKRIADENNLAAPLHYPSYFPVRWCEYTHRLLTASLRNWRVSINYFESEHQTGLLRKWLSYDRLHFMTFLTDLLFLLKNFQKFCQGDSISILELLPKRQELFEQLTQLKHRCLEGGWEELFKRNTINRNGKIYFYGNELIGSTNHFQRTRRNNTFRFTYQQRNYIIDSLIARLKLRLDLDSTLCAALKPLDKIIQATTYEDLATCHSQIIPDMNRNQFVEEYFTAAQSLQNYEFKSPLDSLKRLNDLYPDELLTIKIALARVAAAKPSSADVERLIHVYNTFKDDDRASLSPSTLYNYLYINTNMPPVADFDPTAAVNRWMAGKDRRPKANSKAKSQEWFNGVFKEASLRKTIERQSRIQF